LQSDFRRRRERRRSRKMEDVAMRESNGDRKDRIFVGVMEAILRGKNNPVLMSVEIADTFVAIQHLLMATSPNVVSPTGSRKTFDAFAKRLYQKIARPGSARAL
jgi:hypothetical protein